MKRIDRILNEARLMRIRRAGRTQGVFPAEPGYDWLAESGSVQALLDQLSEDALPDNADKRRLERIDVLDLAVLGPFVAAASAAVASVIDAMKPEDAVFASTMKSVAAMFGDERLDLGRAREGAVRDVAALAVQMTVFEIVRRTAMHIDAGRVLGDSSDPASIVIEGGRARRMRRPRRIENAAEIAGAALAGRPVPDVRLAASPYADPALSEAVREVRARRRAAKSDPAGESASPVKAGTPAQGPSV